MLAIVYDDYEFIVDYDTGYTDTEWYCCVDQCHIMRDLSRVGASGIGKSRGYAFISFTDHGDALTALKAINNRPGILGDNKVL